MNAILYRTTATSGTYTAPDTQQNVLLVHEAGLTLTFTIAFPATPLNGQQVSFVSTGGIAGLTLSAVVGTIINALTNMTAGVPATYTYFAETTKWYRTN